MDLLCGWPSLASGRLESSWNLSTVWGPSVTAWRNSARWLLTATAYCDRLTFSVRGNLLLRTLWHLKDARTVKWNLKLGTVWLFLFPLDFICLVFVCDQLDSHMPPQVRAERPWSNNWLTLLRPRDDIAITTSRKRTAKLLLFPLFEPSQKLLVFFS